MAKRYNTRSKKTRRGGKSKYSSKPKVMLMDAQAVRQLTVYRYPFSTATSNPKVPDGKLTQSIGYRWQYSSVIEGGNMLIVLHPILMTMGTALPVTTGDLNPNKTTFHWNINAAGGNTAVFPGNLAAITYSGAIGRWRVVSQALKLKCVNSDDHNDGHWEAIRIPSTNNMMVGPEIDLFVGSGKLSNRWINEVKMKQNWLLNPTYQSGKIKNLGQYEFRLSPQKEEHDLISMPKVVEFDIDNYDVNGDQVLADGIDDTHLWRYLIDEQFDTILIKIQGSEQNPVTRILSHWVQNVETTPTVNHENAIFQTECVDAGASLKKRLLEFKREERLPGKFVGGARNT